MLFHATLKMGQRSDTFYIQSSSETKVKNFLTTVSESELISLKKVVYSKKYNINYTEKNHIETDHNLELNVIVSSKSYSDEFVIRYPKKTLDLETITKTIKKYVLLYDEKIESIIDVTLKRI